LSKKKTFFSCLLVYKILTSNTIEAMETLLSLKQLSKQALSLNGLQRAKLAEMLVVSLDTKTLSAIDKSWIRLASKRSAQLTSGKVKSIEGKKALLQARKKLK